LEINRAAYEHLWKIALEGLEAVQVLQTVGKLGYTLPINAPTNNLPLLNSQLHMGIASLLASQTGAPAALIGTAADPSPNTTPNSSLRMSPDFRLAEQQAAQEALVNQQQQQVGALGGYGAPLCMQGVVLPPMGGTAANNNNAAADPLSSLRMLPEFQSSNFNQMQSTTQSW
jgi:hypothetical protein